MKRGFLALSRAKNILIALMVMASVAVLVLVAPGSPDALLQMNEDAIGCDVAYRDAAQAWRAEV